MGILEGLNDKQQEAVLQIEGPVLILAGAGSGKTRVLTHRVAYLLEEGARPFEILAVTFTNKAAKEMKERVAKLVGPSADDIWVSTFHSTCVRILRRWIESIGYGRSFTIYDADDQKSLMKDVCKFLDIDTKKIKEKSILGVISKAKDELIGPDEFEMMSGNSPVEKKYAAAYREYQKRLKASNALDFDDLIFLTVKLFRENPDILERYRKRFRFIMVDEYQDTNTSQFELIRLMASHKNEYGETEHNLCVVGDDDQSIYRFRGANIRNILDFEKNYPEAKVIKLEQNYRSTKSILNTANEVIHNNVGRKDKVLWTDNDEGDPVRYTLYSDDRAEASEIVSEIADRVDHGVFVYSDYAILYRTNAQSRSFEELLVRRNIPYKVIGSVNFYQRKEIKDMLAYLRTIDNGLDDMAAKRIINVPKRGIGLTTIDKISDYALEQEISFYAALRQSPFIPSVGRAVAKIDKFVSLIEVLRSRLSDGMSLKALMEEILEATGYIDELRENEDEEKVDDRIGNLDELMNKMADFEENAEEELAGSALLSAFLEEVSLVGDIDNYDEESDYVVLMTIHSAKGLEFKNVYLVGLEEGIFPSFMAVNSDTPSEDIEEERRLCYVGITRAQENLFLSAAKQRMMRGEITFNKCSRFINEIPRYLLKYEKGTTADNDRLADERGSRRYGSADDFSGYERDGDRKSENRGYSSFSAGTGGLSGVDLLDALVGKKNNATAAKYDSSIYSSPAVRKGMGTADTPDYQVGDMVSHVKFGQGRVVDMIAANGDYQVTVDFSGVTRKLLASFAKLKKI